MPGKKLALDDVDVDVEAEDENKCTECGGKIIRYQGCKECRDCGTRYC